MTRLPTDPAAWLHGLANDFLAASDQNRFDLEEEEPAWKEALLGFSAGDDPLWAEYQSHIGDFFWSPAEVLSRAYPGEAFEASAITVISWILPQRAVTKKDNTQQTRHPAKRWAQVRHQGEICNEHLRRHVESSLRERGIKSAAPQLMPDWEQKMSPTYAHASTWSERHAAYTAGLGTFGLCDGLITARGKAIRAGSVVAQMEMESTLRPYDDHHAYCLHFSQGSCKKCVDRCPVRALSAEGHDKNKCAHFTLKVNAKYCRDNFGIPIYACGLCQVGVPCESHIPFPEEGL